MPRVKRCLKHGEKLFTLGGSGLWFCGSCFEENHNRRVAEEEQFAIACDLAGLDLRDLYRPTPGDALALRGTSLEGI